MKNLNKIVLLSGALFSLSATAADSAYDHHASTINEAKWQVGSNSQERCYESGCESTMASSFWKQFIYANSSTEVLVFTNAGGRSSGWRNELRNNNEFNRSGSNSMSTRFKDYSYLLNNNSPGFTISQIHMDDDNVDVDGPPARLELLDGDTIAVKFRSCHDCSSPSYPSEEFSTSIGGWKSAVLSLSGSYVNVTVAGETHSYNLAGSGTDWPNYSDYYFKAGVYMQDYGRAHIAFDYINW